ncbi:MULTISPECIES: phosphodiester glycosidase family protein [Lachnospira]|jgi:exopolysaccharide biosynthesis protein|uniref:Exopolysaccharide biosynthesis protein n=2 Tax=Lachnospira TaxID=28050 RepID=A0A1H5VK52_9FIRM|nr:MULTISPECIES: phosphodiester glycosidase family protein [Lachnospira]MCR5516780.1 phosphodiester glycosidase family protein [Lachnospira sp.]SDN08050.1 Exopolysaccharide biosynthesis protein [Lachnospira pectinoschiza]SEF87649.1 Exopolysaccharide biosynthesis protein [Lachnospira multipara]
MTKKVLKNVSRVLITLLVTIAIFVCFLYGVMAMLVFGPSKTAKTQFVLSVRETSAIGFLANLFVSNEEINRIEAENSIKDTTEVTNTSLVSTDTATSSDNIEVIDIKGSSFKGKLMIIDDPSRLFVGTVESFHEGEGEVVASMAERYGAVAGINGGEFVDGVTTYTAMPVGLVMVNGEVLNGNEDETYHVTGISNDNKLVIGNMTMARAKELGIRDCVSVSNLIGPFLIVNGEMQDVSGTGGGLNPRTAIGQTADGKILLLVCDGRQITGMGASFADLQDIMAEYGAVNASVMDGGTSTQMYYNGEVINNPYSPTGPRTCPTAFLIK